LRSNARGCRNAPNANDYAGLTNDIAGRTNAKVKDETKTVDLPVGGRATSTRGIKSVVSPVILSSNARGGGQDASGANVNERRTNGIDGMMNAQVEDERRTYDTDKSNGASRFSDVDPLSHLYEDDDTEEQSWGVKRRRVDPLSLKSNRAFLVFLREEVATGGWKIPDSELRDMLASSYLKDGRAW
jgi:hypothetical protein